MSKFKRIKTIDVKHKNGSTPVVISQLDEKNYFGAVVYQISHLVSPAHGISPDIEYIYSSTAEGAEKESITWIIENIAKVESINVVDNKQKT